MHCFLFPFCVITCYLEVYDAEERYFQIYIQIFHRKDEKENVVKGIL
jgi:hypothetical protein